MRERYGHDIFLAHLLFFSEVVLSHVRSRYGVCDRQKKCALL